jgi:CIC family chloride channel protein
MDVQQERQSDQRLMSGARRSRRRPALPRGFRRFIAEGRFLLLALGALAGAAGGAVAAIMGLATQALHVALYQLEPGIRLSGAIDINPMQVLVVLVLGGLAVGYLNWLWKRLRQPDIVDPVEANALFGGRMSLRGSLFFGLQAIASNGAGASVGLEGGFTQGGSAIASWLGQVARLRRDDVRLLVACGAGGAIAGAFDAPFAGAAYGFELILASYAPAVLPPLALAALAGKYTAQIIAGHVYRISVDPSLLGGSPTWSLVLALGVACGLLAIVLMRGVTLTETGMTRMRVPTILAPALGGAAVALLAMLSPHVLSAGHGALELVVAGQTGATVLLAVFVLKLIASAISIGSGFRGGLFSTSLFAGALLGGGIGALLIGNGLVGPETLGVITLMAMCAFAAAVVGAPLAMVLLAMEITGRIEFLPHALLAIVAATVTARALFGYSFSTWRLHVPTGSGSPQPACRREHQE